MGPKLVGTGAVDGTTGAQQGFGVGLSSDGLTAIVGGPFDNNEVGAAWIYARRTIGVFPIPDMDGDGKSDLAVWRASTGTWSWLMSTSGYDVAKARSRQWGNQSLGDVPLTGDVDGDGQADLIVWRASTGTWYWLTSSSGYDYAQAGSRQWGNQSLGDVPLVGDVDGDGKADLIVWRASTGTWYWLTSTSRYNVAAAGSKQFGNQLFGDSPLVGDLDGDGKVDLTVWRASTGTWYWLTSASGYDYASVGTAQWGNSSLRDVPLLGDADGDGKADLIVWRASTGTWYYLTSRTAYDPGQAVRLQFGNPSLGDVPLLGQFDGDRIVDLTVWRGSTGTWYWLTSTSNYNPALARSKQWGNQAVGDVPLQIVVPPMVR